LIAWASWLLPLGAFELSGAGRSLIRRSFVNKGTVPLGRS